jgi:hypothetical protein
MKLLRFGPAGQEKPGLLDAGGVVRDLSGRVADFAGDGVSIDALETIRTIEPESLPPVAEPGRIGPCLGMVPNFLLYRAQLWQTRRRIGHARAQGADHLFQGGLGIGGAG